MGWLFSHSTRAQLIATLIKPESNESMCRETLKHTLRGNVLWSVVRFTARQDGFLHLTPGQTLCLIVCDLLQSSGRLWGYKSLSELDGPCYFTCPKSYLSMAPAQSPEWRARVLAYHAGRTARRVAS